MTALLLILFSLLHTASPEPTPEQLKKIHGSIYITDVPAFADYRVYVEKDHLFSALKVYQVKSLIYANGPGLWHFTSNQAGSDYNIYFESERGFADFSISYVDAEIFSGVE